MSTPGTETNPLRVAIVGSGPAGFYTVSNFFKHKGLHVQLDMFEKLPTPFGLVRAGVAPDHQKYKSVTRAYDKSAANAAFRFFGNVEFGKHVKLEDLRSHYHQIIFATGAQSDRPLRIPGEDASGSHSATDFVAWYNAHPEFVNLQFDLSAQHVAVIGLGNVAVDVARILCKTPEELRTTDIADYALEALAHSQVKTVTILGRRGPAQAAFTPPEIKEMGELAQTDVQVHDDEAQLDEVSRNALAQSGDKNAARNVEIINEFAQWQAGGRDRKLIIRFMVSPTEILTSADNKVRGIRIVRNEAYLAADGSVRVRPTQTTEELPAELIFRSVGYQGIALPDVPFDVRGGVIPNDAGRVTDLQGNAQDGLYVAGWIKRGPSGVIGSNKTDAKETVACMVADAQAGKHLHPQEEQSQKFWQTLHSRQPSLVTYQDWRELDEIEVRKGVAADRPRVKFTDVSEMLSVLER